MPTTETVPEQPAPLAFPKYMIHKDQGFVVRFTSPTEGVYWAGVAEQNIGQASSGFDPTKFKDMIGFGTFQNDLS